ncbi:hypothetical protein BPC006_II2428 [Burkholderia pseudomallei BPC006]|nr:hypothetical protein BPC006_II2428 [Burkholderia pseudomallei BPC006]
MYGFGETRREKAISVRNVARRQCVRCCRRHGRRDAGHQVSAAAARRRAA